MCEEDDRLWDEAMRELGEWGVDSHEAMRRACMVLEAAERADLGRKREVITLAPPVPFLIVQYLCDQPFDGCETYWPRLVFVHADGGRAKVSEEFLQIVHARARA